MPPEPERSARVRKLAHQYTPPAVVDRVTGNALSEIRRQLFRLHSALFLGDREAPDVVQR